MRTGEVIVLVVGIAAVLGVGGWLAFRRKTPTNAPMANPGHRNLPLNRNNLPVAPGGGKSGGTKSGGTNEWDFGVQLVKTGGSFLEGLIGGLG